MHPEIARAWSVLLIRGICNVLFALVAFLRPGLTLVVLVLVWGVYAVIDGAMSLSTGIAARRGGGPHWSLILAGTSGLVAGIVACIWPGITLVVLATIMAMWAIARGVFEIVAAIRLRHVLTLAWLLAVSGAASVLFGVTLVIRPAIGLLTLVWLAGAAALVYGAVAIALAFYLRGYVSDSHGPPSHLPA
jgi:uncharacterized membrane protein HdeD (DUF308 family)